MKKIFFATLGLLAITKIAFAMPYDSGAGGGGSGGGGSGTVSAGTPPQVGIYTGATTIGPSSIASDNGSTFTIVGVLQVSSGTTGTIATGSNQLGLFTSTSTAAATFNTSSTTINNASLFLQGSGIYSTGNNLFFGNNSGTNLGDFGTSSMTITGAVTGTAVAMRSTAADSSTSGRTINFIQDDGATGSSARLGLIAFSGNNNNGSIVSCGGIAARASQTWTSSANGTELYFSVCGTASAALNPFFGMLATSATTGRFHFNSTNGGGTFVGTSTVNIASSTAATDVFSIFGATAALPTTTQNRGTMAYTTGDMRIIFSTETVASTNSWSTLVRAGGLAPTIQNCGTSPSVTGGSDAFTITVGGTIATCNAVFSQAYATAPTVVFSERTGSVVNVLSYTVTAASVTFNQTGLNGNVLDVIVIGR